MNRLVPTEQIAERTFVTFYDRAPKRDMHLGFSWPREMQEIGIGRAEIYRSNKWQRDLREFDEYKHVVEGDRTMLVTEGFVREWAQPNRRIPVVGPTVKILGPMPGHVTRLGPLLGLQMRLYEDVVNDLGVLPSEKDVGWFEMRIAHAWLASAEHPETGEVFLCVYDKHGVHVILTGGRLSIEKDGIAG